ncbi:MAG: ribosomal-processing cysteine protease Prp [Candidatus Paralactobacillus gallistercoris]|uniref:Ribosomal processing cysteine protease Prp n=1 Tax=Candidatus Paralactobacillus gallistercoris TaxID=2838724 RepID=A0A948TKA0_9LACO|nr:ribosomal-processing cysteine protease Prp [Candidatus Paralactobacillus gallistercoris]
MIKAIFHRDQDGRIVSFTIKGHADSGPYGYDIVCAAVSATSIGTINGIDALAGFQPQVAMDNDNGGYLSVKMTDDQLTDHQIEVAQILLENLLLTLQDIQKQYGQFVSVITN